MPTESVPREPEIDAEVRRWVLDHPAQLQVLRASLVDALAGHAVDEVAEKMLLVATELATNALKYGLPPTVVLLCRSGPDYLIDVIDHDPDSKPEGARENRPAGGGLGLILARAMALDVGWYMTTSTKHVWARIRGRAGD